MQDVGYQQPIKNQRRRRKNTGLSIDIYKHVFTYIYGSEDKDLTWRFNKSTVGGDNAPSGCDSPLKQRRRRRSDRCLSCHPPCLSLSVFVWMLPRATCLWIHGFVLCFHCHQFFVIKVRLLLHFETYCTSPQSTFRSSLTTNPELYSFTYLLACCYGKWRGATSVEQKRAALAEAYQMATEKPCLVKFLPG